MDSIWTVSSFLIALLLAAGLALMAIPNPPFDAIRLCFIAAAAVTGAATVLWATKAPHPLWVRATCAGVLGAAVLIILPETLRWLSARELSSAAPSAELNTANPVQVAAESPIVAGSAVIDVPYVHAIQPRVRQAHRDPDGRVNLGLGPVASTMTMRYALLAAFRNEPTAERPTRKAYGLTAFVTLNDPSDHASGFWLESFSRAIDLDQGEEASVVIAFTVEKKNARLVNLDQSKDVSFWSCPANGELQTA